MRKHGMLADWFTPLFVLKKARLLQLNRLTCMNVNSAGRLLAAAVFCCAFGFYSAASFAVIVPPSNESLEAQIEFIDQEILLLRAELAQSNQDIPAFQRYLQQLNALNNLAPIFQPRLESLQQFNQQVSQLGLKVPKEAKLAENIEFKMPSEGSQVLVLLPLSGDYQAAGQSILQGLQAAWPLNKAFTVIDSGLYESMNELWELVKLYQPDFIIGPLEPNKARAFQTLAVQVPTLYLNQLDTYRANEKGLSPSKVLGLDQLKAFVDTLGLERVLVLSDASNSALSLQNGFQQAWSTLEGHRTFEAVNLDKGVHQSMAKALNVQRSNARKNWIQKTVGLELEFEARARQDIEAVIFFSSIDEAIQIKPILDFYHLNSVFSLWYPSTYPTAEELLSQQHNWQQTYAFLPPYLVQVHSDKMDSIAQDFSTPINDDDLSVPKSGLFYALGELVAEIVKNSRINQANQPIADSTLGTLITNQEGRLSILPNVFWLDDKQIQPVNE
ncbi:MAG: penicillin-binding protein activator [Thiotrichales bacterium]|nr:penicillin-binding protein activator [Thiotrichales bacterium]